jgi:hypothetical protein
MSLLDTIQSYEVIPEVDESHPLILNIRVAKTPNFLDYVDSKEDLPQDVSNTFGSKESSIGLYLAQALLGLCSNSSIYQTNLVLYLGVQVDVEVLHLINLFSSGATLALSKLYDSPKVLVNLYAPPADQVITYQRYWQMCWFAHLRRCLGEVYRPHIPKYNREWDVKDLQSEFEADPHFNWDNLSNNLKYGYQFFNGRLCTRNFCAGTSGDLY